MKAKDLLHLEQTIIHNINEHTPTVHLRQTLHSNSPLGHVCASCCDVILKRANKTETD